MAGNDQMEVAVGSVTVLVPVSPCRHDTLLKLPAGIICSCCEQHARALLRECEAFCSSVLKDGRSLGQVCMVMDCEPDQLPICIYCGRREGS